ncbi:hypothetical protein [Mucilaginibacter frigoritolerans]|nr:hypothetical protein [Mucilaginibacter frigoritolerans]
MKIPILQPSMTKAFKHIIISTQPTVSLLNSVLIIVLIIIPLIPGVS